MTLPIQECVTIGDDGEIQVFDRAVQYVPGEFSLYFF